MNLISKKDLLAITGISYGQLYRWKRERLIPEEWFIKQSAYTGQETFFPRDQILSRIKSIQDLKDDFSLEELAKMLSPEAAASKMGLSNLHNIEEIDGKLLERLAEIYDKEHYEFIEIALMIAISRAVRSLNLTAVETGDLFGNSIAAATAYKSINITCTIFQAGDEVHTLFTQNPAKAEFDAGIAVIDQIHLSEIADNLKLKYKNLFMK